MSTVPYTFSMGESASASQINADFLALQEQGNAILDTMSEIQLTTLVDYQRALDALGLRQQQALRVQADGVVMRFVVSDFDSIDQGQTTATVRIDTASATLRERNEPSQVLVASTSFSSSSGTVQAINSAGTLFSVSSPAGVPTGTFNLTLAELVALSLLTIDISAMSAAPSISVSTSPNGLTWTQATSISLSGDTLNVWLPNLPTLYVQVNITPAQPDNLGGSTYTFGITDLSGASVNYNLVSDLFFVATTFPVTSAQVQLQGDDDPNLTYYLTLNGGGTVTPIVVELNTPIDLPGVTLITTTVTATAGVLSTTIPPYLIPGTYSVYDSDGNELPVVPGLSSSDPHIANLVKPHVLFETIDSVLTPVIVPHPAGTPTYVVQCLSGLSEISVSLRVHMSTTDSTVTPIFSGAYLEELAL
jgi:hypothetical protein